MFGVVSLAIMPRAVQANNSRYIVPDLTNQRIVKKEQDNCARRAILGAAAFANAQAGITIESQLELWDEFSLSASADDFMAAELLTLREIIIKAWVLHSKVPTVKPNDYGDFIYGLCIDEGIAKTATIKF